MITIGQRVQYSIEAVERGEFEHALEHASIALVLTAKAYYKTSKNNDANYKDFLKEYSWLIEMMSLGSVNLDESKFGNYPLESLSGEEIKDPTFQDFLYHIVRCGLANDEALPPCFSFKSKEGFIYNADIIALPNKLIWGLLAAIVFCPINAMQKTSDGYWLSLAEHKFIINETWGKEDLILQIYEERQPTSFALNITDDYLKPKLTA
jgi:hypothetical protein